MPRAMLLLMLLSAAGAAAAAADYIDITVPVTTGMPSFAHRASGLPLAWRLLTTSLANDGLCNQSFLSMDAHTGTHIDAPCHFLDDGHGIEDLDLSVLIGPALVVRVPDGSNITADMLKSLKLPTEARRVLFKTANTERRLMWRSAFASDYIGLDTSAANHITQETDIALVGIDYLSIARLEDIEEPHKILFRKGVVAVEGLDLSQVEPGWYQQICLPPKLAGSDGAPVRCLLQPLSSGNRPAAAAGRHSSDEL